MLSHSYMKTYRRQKGKIAELALGYGGSVGALKAMGAIDMGLTEDELPTLVDAWRQSNPHIIQFWWDVDHAVTEAVKYKHTTTGYVLTFYCRRGMLFITLPSGRNLVYVKPKAMHRSLRIRISMHFSRVYVSFMMTLC